MELNWIPSERVGPFRFGARLPESLIDSQLESVPEEYDAAVDWEVFRVAERDDVRVYVEANAILVVACHGECRFRGVNIIGLTVAEFSELLGVQSSQEPDQIELYGDSQRVFEFDQVGAQVWASDNVIVSIMLSQAESDDTKEEPHPEPS